LNDAEYRQRLARAVLSGVRSYFIDNPLTGTQFSALHDPSMRRNERAMTSVQTNGNTTAAPIYLARSTATKSPVTTTASTNAAANSLAATNSAMPAATASGTAPVQLASANKGQQTHVVQPGERLIDIANQYGVSLMRLREVNDLDGNSVIPGQQILIPKRLGSG
ncbi:MAG TPA: LysM peptidoglycan-binding domain-containing protein, partial [Xanthomonadaceae bacterium]|nr:LysM peptidoglycan-binding domain-containing protein [Xanthomonadaceae bacterium]